MADEFASMDLAIGASPGGVLVARADGTIALANPEVERQFGYARGELIGQLVEVLLPEALRAVHREHRAGFQREPAVRPMGVGRVLEGRRKDGTRILVEIGLSPIRTDEGILVVASVVDVSERLRQEERQRRAREEQLVFDRVLTELPERFLNVPSGRVEEAIGDSIGQICHTLDFDGGGFYRLRPEPTLPAEVVWPANPGSLRVTAAFLETRCPWTFGQLLAGTSVSFATLADIPCEDDRRSYQEAEIGAASLFPLWLANDVIGALAFSMKGGEHSQPPELTAKLERAARVFEQIVERLQRDTSLRAALETVKLRQDALTTENAQLRREMHEPLALPYIVGQSAALRRVLAQVQEAGAADSPVLLFGETGTEKELFARQIHELSARRTQAMVRVNCASIPTTLIESELFGREKDALPGATSRHFGRFELAHGSTIFLDEIGDLPIAVQGKLLRLIQERQFERLGSQHAVPVDVRIIAATHHDLSQRVAAGMFLANLYSHLKVFTIQVPPLRDRREDIALLVWRFVEKFANSLGKQIDSIADESIAALQSYNWPGNLLELHNVVERAMITTQGCRLFIEAPTSSSNAALQRSKLVDVERDHLRSVLETTGWRIRGESGAAERLGLKPTTLETRMAKLGLKRPRR